MNLIVLPATIPDIQSAFAVYFASFADQVILDVLYPAGTSSPEFRKEHAEATAGWWADEAAALQHMMKCVDTDTGEIVGMAIWDVWWRGRNSEERMEEIEIPWLEGKEWERAEAFFHGFWKKREENVGGKRHVYLQTIAVHPSHQRRGIGKLLMKWGIDVAKRMNVPVYLEATHEGVPLYKKCGFETLKKGVLLESKVTKWEKDVVVPLMVRMPKGLNFEEWTKSVE